MEPKIVYCAGNRTSVLYFESEKDALIYQASTGAASGIEIHECQIIRSTLPTDEHVNSVKLLEALEGMQHIFDRALPSSSVGRKCCDDAIKALAKAHGKDLFWICKNCGANSKPRCHKCVREDGKLVEDELVEE